MSSYLVPKPQTRRTILTFTTGMRFLGILVKIDETVNRLPAHFQSAMLYHVQMMPITGGLQE